ncbi:MAG TPA: 3-oxoacyl-ACP reductase FabG [Cytophagaceae bacterium]|jgi:3-oxoacyl-[acyl-carrier protein] reductase|nr:3-oxoacyl-ACP reductase FabG [Cytophagaceae bacterium]
MVKFALVTGGSRGIGRAICEELAGMGYQLLINYRSNKDEAEKTLESIRQKGSDGELLKFDVGNQKETEEVLGGWIERNTNSIIEVLVNNAGIRKDNLMLLMPVSEWKEVMNTSVDGFFNVTSLVLKGMIFNKYGRIVNIVSLSGIKGLPGQTNYSASKAAVIGATKALSQEIGRRGITVNAVAPGFIKTDMTEGINEADYKSVIPVGRFGETKEVADTVCFLASSKASYITGEVICVSGGLN